MKKNILLIFISILVIACVSKNNDKAFIETYTGRYLYNADEIIEVYFESNELYLKWRGAERIKPLKVDDNAFYVKEMNEKIQFITDNAGQHFISLIPKDENSSKTSFRKLAQNEKIPSEFLKNNEFEKALEAYKKIKETDSLNTAIDEAELNRLGYNHLRNKEYTNAINIFRINAALYPKSSNVYDSLGEAYMKSGDTIQAIKNYKKSLELDSGNRRAEQMIEKMTSQKAK